MRDEEQWDSIPSEERSIKRQTQIYQMLARSCSRAMNSIRQHENYPYKMFGRLEKPSLAPAILEDAKCPKRLDPWSKSFGDHYSQNITCTEALMDLRAAAILAKEETVHIEKQHSWLCRFVFSRAAQSRYLDLAGLNEQWCSKTVFVHGEGLVASRPGSGRITCRRRCFFWFDEAR